MRRLKHHEIEGVDPATMVESVDDPDPNGANSRYDLYVKQHGSWERVASVHFDKVPPPDPRSLTPPPPHVPNGIDELGLVSILMDRFEARKDERRLGFAKLLLLDLLGKPARNEKLKGKGKAK